MKFFGGKKDKAAVFLPASEGDFKIVRREGVGLFGGQRQGAQGGQGVRSAQNAAAPLRGPIPFAVCGGAAPRAAGASGQEAAKQALWARYAGTVAFLLAQAQKVAPQAVRERTAAAAPKNAEKAGRAARDPFPPRSLCSVCCDPFARSNGSAVESAGAVRGTIVRTGIPAAEHALEEGFARLSRLAGLNVAERLAARG